MASFSSSVDICREGGDIGGDVVRVGKAGVGGTILNDNESLEGDEAGEYIGDE